MKKRTIVLLFIFFLILGVNKIVYAECNQDDYKTFYYYDTFIDNDLNILIPTDYSSTRMSAFKYNNKKWAFGSEAQNVMIIFNDKSTCDDDDELYVKLVIEDSTIGNVGIFEAIHDRFHNDTAECITNSKKYINYQNNLYDDYKKSDGRIINASISDEHTYYLSREVRSVKLSPVAGEYAEIFQKESGEKILSEYNPKGETCSLSYYAYQAAYENWEKKIDQIYENIRSNCNLTSEEDVYSAISKRSGKTGSCKAAIDDFEEVHKVFKTWFLTVDVWSFSNSFDGNEDFKNHPITDDPESYRYYRYIKDFEFAFGRKLDKNIIDFFKKYNESKDKKDKVDDSCTFETIKRNYKNQMLGKWNSSFDGIATMCWQTANSNKGCPAIANEFKSCFDRNISAAGPTGEENAEVQDSSKTATNNVIKDNKDAVSDYYKSLDEAKEIASNINFDFGSLNTEAVDLVIDCDKFAPFQWAWNIIIYSAPFLLIIFGSIDYIKVVTAGDIEAMKKAKKNFKIRLIAFVILLVMPAILKLLVGNITSYDSNAVKALRCIIDN